MNRQIGVAGLVLSAVLLSACAGQEEDTSPTPRAIPATTAPSSSQTAAPSAGGSTEPMPTPWESGDIPEGATEESAAATAQRFLEAWVQFSPANFDAKDFWFESWEDLATADFRSQMRVQADSMWSWTWNRSEKACCVEFPEPSEATLSGDKAVAKVTLERQVYDLFATADELLAQPDTGQTLTYLVHMDATGDGLLVDEVVEVDQSTPLPAVG